MEEQPSRTEKDELELEAFNEYGTKAETNGDEIKENMTPPRGFSDGETTDDGNYNSNDLIDEDELKQKWWIKLCPWLLKWPWLKRRLHRKKETKTRSQWDNRAQYVLTLVGYAVGLGNVWRFSYLVAKNGGAAYVIPYIIMLFIVGIPLFYLETLVGQSLQRGPILAWYKICPNLWGIGLGGIIVTVYICLYYNVIISWVILYFFRSFQDPLPWAKCCGHVVSLANDTANNLFIDSQVNGTYCGGGTYFSQDDFRVCINDSTRYYWYKNTLEATEDISIAGQFNWRVMLTLFAAWVVVYLCMFKGIQSSGKVVYFTATFPYVVLVILFFRAVTLDGAGDGLKFLFVPDPKTITQKLFQPQVWLEAATQIFFSLGLAIGALIALASYSKQSSNALVDTLVVCFTNSFTSIFSSIVIFSIVGFKAKQLGVKPELVSQGPGLAFVVFSEALTLMPVSPLWAVLFFIMLFLLGLDSQFATVEGLITVLRDSKRIRKYRKELLVGVICIIFYLCSFPFMLGNGLHLFQLVDQYSTTLPLLFIGLCEIVTISWIYGVNKFFDGVQYNIHPYMKKLWWFIWTFLSPIIMIIIFFGSVINELIKPLHYTVFKGDIVNNTYVMHEERLPYPDWAQFIGAVITLSSILCVPCVLIIRIMVYHRARKQMKEFWELTKSRYYDFSDKVGHCVLRTQSWTIQNDDVDNGDVPYFNANEGPTPTDSMSVTSVESADDEEEDNKNI